MQVGEVSRRLAVQTGVEKRRLDRTISEEERRTLEALGYVE
jgi:hypothetical protein